MYTKYLPIASFNLSHYFRIGLVAPTNIITNRNEDIQNKYETSLLFSSNKYTPETDCSLEVVLTYEEFNQLNSISEHFSLFPSVLPISRVKSIFFIDNVQKEKTIWNIRDGAAFIPDNLIFISGKDNLVPIEEIKNLPDVEERLHDLNDKLILFDKLLGGFAMMRLGGERWMNFSKNYFPTISLFNQVIEMEWKNSKISGENNFEWLILQQNKHRNFAKEAVFSDVSMELVERYAKRENVRLEKKFGNIQLDKIEAKSLTYLASILLNYGEAGRKTIDDFINFLITSELEPERKEGISLMFGINKGYKTFRNRYKTEEFEVDVKFKLDNQLDYYIVESIYQYAFNGKSNNNSFPYIDDWCPKLSTKSQDFSKFETDRILDQIVIYKKKVAIGSSEYFQELYQSISPINIYTKIIHSINNWMPAFFKTDRILEGSQFFENELKEDLEIIIKSIYENVHGNLADSYKGETDSLKTDLKNLTKRYDELELVNQDLINQIENITKQDQPVEIDKLTDPRITEEIIKTEEKDNPNSEIEFPEENGNKEHENLNLKIKRGKELENLRIGDLRKIATGLGVSGTENFKGNKQGKKELSNEIINLEFPNRDL